MVHATLPSSRTQPTLICVACSGLRLTLEQILGCVIWQGAYLSMCEQYRKDAKWCLDHLQRSSVQQQQLQQQQPATESMAA